MSRFQKVAPTCIWGYSEEDVSLPVINYSRQNNGSVSEANVIKGKGELFGNLG